MSNLTFWVHVLNQLLLHLIDDRPGRSFRECDHVYEKIFGYENFKTSEVGCNNYEVPNILGWYTKEDEDKVKDSVITGILCVCGSDRCNRGIVSLDESVALNSTSSK